MVMIKAVLILVMIGLVPFQSAFADLKDEAKTILQQRDAEIKELLGPEGTDYTDEQRQQIKDIINDVMDYRAIAQYALQDQWNEMSEDERTEFVEILSAIIRDQSMNNLDIYRADVVYDSFEEENGMIIAHTTAILENRRVPVVYNMVKANGEWMVTDTSINNSSTAESYRRSFQNILRRRGYDALVESLKRRAGMASQVQYEITGNLA